MKQYISPFRKQANQSRTFSFASQQKSRQKLEQRYLSQFKPQTWYRFPHQIHNDISYFQQSKYKIADPLTHKESYESSKCRVIQASKNRNAKISRLFENISNKQKEMKKRANMRSGNNNDQENDPQCTFSPQINRNPRYIIPSTLEERIKNWDQQKVRHYTSIKQELIQTQIKQCTFAPNLVSKPKSTKILKNKEEQTFRIQQKIRDENSTHRKMSVKSPKKVQIFKDKVYGVVDYKSIKQIIKYQLSRIKFDY